jgi:hypothetical protein
VTFLRELFKVIQIPAACQAEIASLLAISSYSLPFRIPHPADKPKQPGSQQRNNGK